MVSKQGKETRAKIINTVIELLKTKGYRGVGLQEIIEKSGAPKGSLYFHFPGGKNEIVEAAIKQHNENIDTLLRMVFLSTPDIATAINELFSLSISELESSDYTKGCPVATTTLDHPGEPDIIQESCAQCFSSLKNIIVEKLKAAGMQLNEAEKQATFIVSSFEGSIILSEAYRNTEPLKTVSEQLSARYASK